MAKPLIPGDRVEGTSKKLLGRRGVVRAVTKVGRMRSYTVHWDVGTSETISARSICRETEASLRVRPILPQVTSGAVGLDAADLSDSGSDMSSSSSSSDEGNVSAVTRALGAGDGIPRPAGAEVTDDGSVYAHGRKWIHCDAVYIDPATFVPIRKASLHWPPHLQLGERSFASYFYLVYPMDALQTTIMDTNKLLSERHHGVIGRGELFRWIGIRLAMTLKPRRGPITALCESSVPEGCVGTAANYGKLYGMTCLRFQNIQSDLRFAPSQAPSEDPWYAVRPLVDSYNKQRKRCISPGAVLCVDECMSSWEGKEEKYTHDGIPHRTKIQRKPQGVGAELKSIADGETGILLGLEIMEGVQRQRQKAYNAEFGEGTAVVLRLSQPYAGSGRTIVADSAFSSIKTLVQLNSLLGLYLMSMVKTATKGYPLQRLNN